MKIDHIEVECNLKLLLPEDPHKRKDQCPADNTCVTQNSTPGSAVIFSDSVNNCLLEIKAIAYFADHFKTK
jgi:hypothetical protein